MKFSNLYCLCVGALCAITSAFSVHAGTVYYDNASSNWTTPHIHYWGGTDGTDWSKRPALTLVSDNIWKYDVPDDITNLLFQENSSGNDGGQTSDQTYKENHVYTFSGDTGKTYEEYVAGTGDDTDPVYVYVDGDWTNVHAYVYKDGGNIKNAKWPGEAMTMDSETGYWKYEVPSNLTTGSYVIINTGGGTDRYPGDNEQGMALNGKSMIFTCSNHEWTQYRGQDPNPNPDPDPVNLTDYKIYFHNNMSWKNVYVKLIGNSSSLSQGGVMTSNLNSTIHEISFTAPEGKVLKCYFYCLDSGAETNKTATFNVVNEHVYRLTGDKGLYSDYDPNNVLPDAEYWLDPAKPTQNQSATLYYNRAFNTSGKLSNTDEIYVWLGARTVGSTSTAWDVYPSCEWKSIDDKYRMDKLAGTDDVYSLTLEPSIASWLGVDVDERLARLAFIFRDKSGNIKTATYFIDLTELPPAGVGLGAYQSHTTDGNAVTIAAEKGTLTLTAMSADVIKVFTAKTGQSIPERESISVVGSNDPKYSLETPESVELRINEDKGYNSLLIDGKERARVSKEQTLVSFVDDNGDVKLSEKEGLVNTIGKVSITFNAMGDAGFYGGGYNGNFMNWDGKTMTMNNTQAGGWAQGASTTRNICIPYFISTSGYGVYVDDHYRGATMLPSSANGSSYMSGSRNPVSYYYIGGGTMEKAMENYTRLTGLQELPPMWALGYITSKYSFESRSEAEGVVNNTKSNGIPLDGIVFDIHWQGNVQCMGKINWDTNSYRDPQQMMQEFRKKNVHTIAITEPYFTKGSGNWDYLEEKGWFADNNVSGMGWLNSQCGLLDVTNSDALEWFKDLYKARTREGIDSWWLDLGEPEKHDGESTYSDGSDINKMHNEYGLRWLKGAYDAMKELDSEYKAPVRRITMPRAGTAGMQRYNAFPWTGDIQRSWGGLKAQVPALVSASMSGVSFLGSDIGGFNNPSGYNDNVYLRWVQLGVFYPMMRTHSAVSNGTNSGSPLPYDHQSVLDNVRDAINLRYAYLPYTYSQAYAYARFGTPIARPANFGDTDKSRLKNSITSYLWGPDIFVAPMLEEGTSRNITFPEGDWLDMNNLNAIYSDNSGTVNYSADYSVLPYFMRRGSFVTRYAQDTFTSTAEAETSKLTVHYFANYTRQQQGSTFFDDDHKDVNSLRDEQFVATHFSGTGSNDNKNPWIGIRIDREGKGWSGMYDNQEMTFQIHDYFGDLNPVVKLFTYGDSESASASAAERAESSNKTDIPQVSSQEALKASAANGYCVDNGSKTIFVKLAALDPLTTYSLGISRNDIFTGMEGINLSCMMLSYGAGTLSYSAPEGTEGLCIDVYSTTGVHAAQYDGLRADGYVSQVSVDLPSGIYIARLTGHAPGGASESKTVKIVVK